MMREYNTIEQALTYIEGHFKKQPELEEIAHHLKMSPFHLQRTFKEWVGISPKRFLQFLTINHARQLLRESRSVLDATYESGLSSPGRIHDLFVELDAVTPGEFKSLGKNLVIEYGKHQSPFGHCLMAVTGRGLCFMGFYSGEDDSALTEDMMSRFPQALFKQNPAVTLPYFKSIFNNTGEPHKKITLFVKGTNFQVKVWEALLKIPAGLVCSYADLGRFIGMPKASRAIGNAVGSNPISYLIPCHRVIQNMGIIGNYHWGRNRKKAMLLWESSAKMD